MAGLDESLGDIMRGSVCVIGLGSADYSDDAFGIRLAEKLRAAGVQGVIVAGRNPERYLETVAASRVECVLFLDAVEMSATPGSTVLLGADEVMSRYPQISTHKIALATLAQVLQARGKRAYLLGVQPKSLKMGEAVSTEVQSAIESLLQLMMSLRKAVSSTRGTAKEESIA